MSENYTMQRLSCKSVSCSLFTANIPWMKTKKNQIKLFAQDYGINWCSETQTEDNETNESLRINRFDSCFTIFFSVSICFMVCMSAESFITSFAQRLSKQINFLDSILIRFFCAVEGLYSIIRRIYFFFHPSCRSNFFPLAIRCWRLKKAHTHVLERPQWQNHVKETKIKW